MKKPLIPFRFFPGSWGLLGSAYDEAEAYYTLTGEELERRLLAIRHKDDAQQLLLHGLDLDLKYGKINAYEAAMEKIGYLHKQGTLEHDLATLEVEYEFGEIDKNVYAKRRATLNNEPWVSFIDSGFDLKQGIDGVFFELDWNPQWVEFLKIHGFVGHTEEDIVEDWFSEVCKSYGQQESVLSVLHPPFIDERQLNK